MMIDTWTAVAIVAGLWLAAWLMDLDNRRLQRGRRDRG